MEHDKWKEEAMLYVDENSEVSFTPTSKDTAEEKEFIEAIEKEGYQEIKNIGTVFFNADNEERLYRFAEVVLCQVSGHFFCASSCFFFSLPAKGYMMLSDQSSLLRTASRLRA